MNGADRRAVRALLDGELDAGAEAALRRRATADPELGAYLERLEGVRSMLRDLRTLPSVTAGFEPRAAPAREIRWGWPALATAAALGLTAWALLPARAPVPNAEPTSHVQVEFALSAPGAGVVQVAGDFSDWRPVALQRDGGRWATELELAPGRYAYMYVVDGRWTADPEAHSFRDDEFGRRNAVLHL